MRAVSRRDLDVLTTARRLDADRCDFLEAASAIEVRSIPGEERRLIHVVGCSRLGVLQQAVRHLDQFHRAREQNTLFQPAVQGRTKCARSCPPALVRESFI